MATVKIINNNTEKKKELGDWKANSDPGCRAKRILVKLLLS